MGRSSEISLFHRGPMVRIVGHPPESRVPSGSALFPRPPLDHGSWTQSLCFDGPLVRGPSGPALARGGERAGVVVLGRPRHHRPRAARRPNKNPPPTVGRGLLLTTGSEKGFDGKGDMCSRDPLRPGIQPSSHQGLSGQPTAWRERPSK